MRSVRCAIATLILAGCGDGPVTHTPPPRDDVYDVDANGIPQLVTADYTELEKVYRISKFRSSVGHSRNDDFETCRSKKHYFQPKSDVDWAGVQLFAPVTGTVWGNVVHESRGDKVSLQSEQNKAFIFTIFHVVLAAPLQNGQRVTSGTLLGTHYGIQTYSDIEVGVHTPAGWRLLSYFEVMPDSLFARYQARGVSTRSALIISKEARDADPLTCNGEQFTSLGTLESWVVLN